jgi:uncharacterized protein
MMIIFQNKIIYMPGVPPFSRSEKVADYQALCKPVIWTEHDLRSGDGTRIAALEGTISTEETLDPKQREETFNCKRRVVVLYFQG